MSICHRTTKDTKRHTSVEFLEPRQCSWIHRNVSVLEFVGAKTERERAIKKETKRERERERERERQRERERDTCVYIYIYI